MSVIIPTYQRSTLIGETLESLLAQTYSHFEAIIVDDGSTDDTADVVARYADPRIRYIRKEHSGLSATRNAGFQHASGEFIAFLDSDDLWLPWKLTTQLELFARHADVGMIWSDMSTFVNRGEIVAERHLRAYYGAYDKFEVTELCARKGTLGQLSAEVPADIGESEYFVGSIFPAMFFGNLVHPPTAIVRRSRLQKSGPFQPEVTGRGAEDYHFYLRVTEQGPVAYLDAPTIHYRIHGTQMSTVNSLPESHADLRLVKHWIPRVSQLLSPSLVRERVARSNGWVGSEELAAGNARAARPFLWYSMTRRPNRETALLLAASLVPEAMPAARALKRRVNRWNGMDRLVRIAALASGGGYVIYRLAMLIQPGLAEP